MCKFYKVLYGKVDMICCRFLNFSFSILSLKQPITLFLVLDVIDFPKGKNFRYPILDLAEKKKKSVQPLDLLDVEATLIKIHCFL